MKMTFLSALLVALMAVVAYAEDKAPEGKKPDAEKKAPEKEAPKKETNVPKPVMAPAFKLKGIDGKDYTLEQFKGKLVVLEWSNYGCPFVVMHYKPGVMQKLQAEYTKKGVVWLTICSTAKAHKDFRSPQALATANKMYKAVPTATLMDANGHVGTKYKAKTTPHMYVIGKKGELLYQGAIDNFRETRNRDVTKNTSYLRQVLNAVLAGKPAPFKEKAPYGCSVKYARPRS